MFNPFGGNKFPYTNFHELNLDWVIKIVKDFLDQYTSLEQTIANGLESLDNKATELEGLLQAWYNSHSEDIANQLAAALLDLNTWYNEHSNDISGELSTALANIQTFATSEIARVAASIPLDYSSLSTHALQYNDNIGTPASYDNKLSKVNIPVITSVSSESGWTDLPEGTTTIIFVNFLYYSAYAMQLAVSYRDCRLFTRFANVSTGALFADWKEYALTSLVNIVENPDPANYNGNLASITKNLKGTISATGWSDYPPNVNTGYIINDFMGYAVVQKIISYPNMEIYMRLCAGGTALGPWIPLSGGNNDILYYALGDSITSGSYSNDEGQGIVATNAQWAYPMQIKRKYGCRVRNIAVPGATFSQLGTQVSQISSESNIVTIQGGVNDYNGALPLGSPSSPVNNNTVCGAIKSVIESVAAIAPNARIVLISPLIIKTGSLSSAWSFNTAGTAGFTFAQLSECMKEIAEYYHIEFIDCTRNGPTNILNIAQVQKDNIHPTKEFYTTIANYIGSQIF